MFLALTQHLQLKHIIRVLLLLTLAANFFQSGSTKHNAGFTAARDLPMLTWFALLIPNGVATSLFALVKTTVYVSYPVKLPFWMLIVPIVLNELMMPLN